MVDSLEFRIGIFIILTIIFTFVSRRSLLNHRSHGFYRYFAFEGLAVLVLHNHPLWFAEPFSPLQCLSWLLLLFSVFLVIYGFDLLKRVGGQRTNACVPENLAFENTQNLVKSGLYRYIRHPMYTSLLFLGWGAFLKQIDGVSIVALIVVTGALFLTARIEEIENIDYFGQEYSRYQLESKMFLPFIF